MPGSSAVGGRSFKSNGDHGIETRVSRVEGRMDALENSMEALRAQVQSNREASGAENKLTHEILAEITTSLGKPSNGPAQPASGLFWAVDQISGRVTPLEKRWEMIKGGFWTLGVILPPIGAVIWFLSGSKLSTLFH